MIEPCPLCKYNQTNFFYEDNRRSYGRCSRCKLIFVAREQLLSNDEEKARYDLHQNSPDNKGYIRFLNQFFQPFIRRIGPPPLDGLDFGSGPEPVLAMIFKQQGYNMALFDPYYAKEPSTLKRTYDFVTCTETVEHFYKPQNEWQIMLKCLKPGAWLGIMTQLVDDLQNFHNLHYITDMTHVSFFSRETFLYLAKKDSLHVEFEADNLIFFKKNLSINENNE